MFPFYSKRENAAGLCEFIDGDDCPAVMAQNLAAWLSHLDSKVVLKEIMVYYSVVKLPQNCRRAFNLYRHFGPVLCVALLCNVAM